MFPVKVKMPMTQQSVMMPIPWMTYRTSSMRKIRAVFIAAANTWTIRKKSGSSAQVDARGGATLTAPELKNSNNISCVNFANVIFRLIKVFSE